MQEIPLDLQLQNQSMKKNNGTENGSLHILKDIKGKEKLTKDIHIDQVISECTLTSSNLKEPLNNSVPIKDKGKGKLVESVIGVDKGKGKLNESVIGVDKGKGKSNESVIGVDKGKGKMGGSSHMDKGKGKLTEQIADKSTILELQEENSSEDDDFILSSEEDTDSETSISDQESVYETIPPDHELYNLDTPQAAVGSSINSIEKEIIVEEEIVDLIEERELYGADDEFTVGLRSGKVKDSLLKRNHVLMEGSVQGTSKKVRDQ
ncbi:hypothetical protein BC833DRAFT_618223 [Globomyces pollinis-pini]|nr:hypothetical protein BC833DRAFT_618223 [Globomyces pollinis-pini]